MNKLLHAVHWLKITATRQSNAVKLPFEKAIKLLSYETSKSAYFAKRTFLFVN